MRRIQLAVLPPMVLVAWTSACGADDTGSGGGQGQTTSATGMAQSTAASGGPVPTAPSCDVAPGAAGAVAAPVLRATLPGSWDENWFASPALADVDGDGKLDVVAARHSVLYAWRADGTAIFQTAFGSSASSSPEHGDTRMYASAVVGDLDGNGSVEIAVGADADSQTGMNVAVYDATGELRPGWPVHFGGSDEVRSIAAGDVDGDGPAEILVNKTSAGPATAVYRLDGSMHAGWPEVDAAVCDPAPPAEPCWDFGGYNQNIGAGDLDGDGVLDVISSYDAIGFGIFHGDGTPFATAPAFADRVVTSVEAYHDVELSQQGFGTGDRSEFTYSPPVIADIDADGTMNVILAGDHEHSSDTTNKGVTVWVLNPDMTRPAGWTSPKDTGMPLSYGDVGNNIVTLAPSPAVGNIDGKPGLEIVVPTYDGKMHAFAPDGTELWTHGFATTGTPYTGASEALIVDLNGDGVPEIVFTTFTSGAPGMPDVPAHLVVLDAGGNELHSVEIFGRGSMAAPSVADLDGDGGLELVVSLKDSLGAGSGGVQIWDLPGAKTNCVLWGTGRGGPLRQGYVPAATP